MELQNDFSPKKNKSPGDVKRFYKIDLKILIHFPSEKMKVVSQHKDVTWVVLLAQGGGYVGMFMGCSLLQLPSCAKEGFSALKILLNKFKYRQEN